MSKTVNTNFEKTTWYNDLPPAIDADQLNRLEKAIGDLYYRVFGTDNGVSIIQNNDEDARYTLIHALNCINVILQELGIKVNNDGSFGQIDNKYMLIEQYVQDKVTSRVKDSAKLNGRAASAYVLKTKYDDDIRNLEQKISSSSVHWRTFDSDGLDESHSHSYQLDSGASIPSTCTSEGINVFKCSCGETYTEKIPASNHTYTSVVTAPTCTEKGYTTHTCSACGYTCKDSEVESLGHDEINHEAKALTCTEIGWNAYVTCSRCDYTTYAEKAAPGHTEVTDAAVAPTCTATGLTEGEHCSVCNEVLVAQEVVAALGHTEVIDAAKAPTCTTTGLTEGKHCSVCGTVIVAQTEVPMVAHKYNEEITKEPTCTTEGVKTYTCICGDSYTENIAALNHTVVIDKEVAATCTATGLTQGSHCSVCNEILVKQQTVPMTSHDYVYTGRTTSGSCTELLDYIDECSICGQKRYRSSSLYGDHDYQWMSCSDAQHIMTCINCYNEDPTRAGYHDTDGANGSCSVCGYMPPQE